MTMTIYDDMKMRENFEHDFQGYKVVNKFIIIEYIYKKLQLYMLERCVKSQM